jgi:hypothetical protein
MDEKITEEQENLDSQNGGADANYNSQSNSNEKPADEKKSSDFPGEELEQPSIRETTAEKTQEVEKVKPVIIEWKKPFFLMFGLGVAVIILMLILK